VSVRHKVIKGPIYDEAPRTSLALSPRHSERRGQHSTRSGGDSIMVFVTLKPHHLMLSDSNRPLET
jgi:hypothetical protein